MQLPGLPVGRLPALDDVSGGTVLTSRRPGSGRGRLRYRLREPRPAVKPDVEPDRLRDRDDMKRPPRHGYHPPESVNSSCASATNRAYRGCPQSAQ